MKPGLCSTLLLLIFLSWTEAKLDFKLKFCRFKCTDPCEDELEDSNPNGRAEQPEAYYWRDFFGDIPSDAFPLGPSTQYPQTYIGLVYDSSKNGTFVTTIIQGINYVYSVLDGKVSKKTTHIQIMCTSHPGQLMWIALTTTNIPTLKQGDTFVKGSYHMKENPENPKYPTIVIQYIVRTTKCGINYAGFVGGLDQTMEYVLMDGTTNMTKSYLFLGYRPKTYAGWTNGKNKAQPFFSHHYEYIMRPNSIIPKFYKQINIGSCSITCTNQDTSKEGKKSKNDKETMSKIMAYYWKPNEVFSAKEAVPVGLSYANKTEYIGQTYNHWNWYDVGQTDGSYITILKRGLGSAESFYFHILSSNHQEKLKWVNTTSDDFLSLDQSALIPGGELDNGTQTFIGRASYAKETSGGSIRVTNDGVVCYTYLGEPSEFQVLTLNTEEKKS